MTAAVLHHRTRRTPAAEPGRRLSLRLRMRLPGAVAAPHRCPAGTCEAVIGAGRLVCWAHRRRLPPGVRRGLRQAWARGGPGSAAWLAAVLAALDAAGAER